MALTYREMRISDIPATLAVRFSTVENAITMEELGRDYGISPLSIADAMKSHVKGWLCEESGKVVGFAMGNERNGEVEVVAVLPEYEDRHIGKSLLARVQNWLFSKGHEEIWLLANPDSNVRAYGFYRKLGWQASGERRAGDEVLILRAASAKGAG